MAIDALLLLLTFALGLALARVSLCAVAALQQLILAQRYDGLLRLLLAASGAGVTLLLLAGLAPGRVLLPAESATQAGALTGGLLLGLGALINGGCYLGSVLYLGSGNLNFLQTLVGIAGGEYAGSLASGLAMPAAGSLRMSMGPAWIAGMIAPMESKKATISGMPFFTPAKGCLPRKYHSASSAITWRIPSISCLA